jgi:prolyl oligopeptidase
MTIDDRPSDSSVDDPAIPVFAADLGDTPDTRAAMVDPLAELKAGADPYLWLENVTGEAALDWVRAQNEPTLAELSGERFEQMRAEALEIGNADTRIPDVARRADYLYNRWIDAEHPRGLWRRTTLEQYRTDTPDWELVLDVDALAAAEDENWMLAGLNVIDPEYTRALISLSRGGSDAAVVREFDMVTRQFVADGFTLPEGRHNINWEDEDTVLVGTDFGDGSLTNMGLPRLVKRWRRGQPLQSAETIFAGEQSDLTVGAGADRTPGFERTLVVRMTDMHNKQCYELRDGELIRIATPTDSEVGGHQQWLTIWPRTDWEHAGTRYTAGSLLVADYEQFLAGTAQLQVVFEPDAHTSLAQYAWTRDRLIIVTRADVASRVEVITPGSWHREPVEGVPDNTDTIISAADEHSNEIFLYSDGFDIPPRLLHGTAGEAMHVIKSSPAMFDASDIVVTQNFATSADGTSIPYFVVGHRDAQGPGPTLLSGYGAYGMSMIPSYASAVGRLWLTRGGTYVLANIRGGGEYGPNWHTQTTRAGRHKVAEDFAAVATDLAARGITTPAQLGARGGSAGGLLMGIMLTQYPQLFGALVCDAPVLDMRRYPLMGVGAASVAEFGDPDDPRDWEFMAKYSPYHNISTTTPYPPVLITAAVNDDRVQPGHARKMTAALHAANQPVLYYERTEGGHGGAANMAQAAFNMALAYEFLLRTLVDGVHSSQGRVIPGRTSSPLRRH